MLRKKNYSVRHLLEGIGMSESNLQFTQMFQVSPSLKRINS